MDKIRKDIPLKDALGSGTIVYSKATDIYYKKENGALMKYAAYRHPKKWESSDFTGTWKAGMRIATEKELRKRRQG